jgi:hypothetical protein
MRQILAFCASLAFRVKNRSHPAFSRVMDQFG